MTPEELRRDHRPVLERMLARLDSEYETTIESFSEDYYQVWEEWCAIKSAMDAADTIERLERENAELRRDAERLNFLRSLKPLQAFGRNPSGTWSVFGPVPLGSGYETLDAAIDAALAAQPAE